MEDQVRNLFISGPVITKKSTIINVLQGVGFNFLVLPRLSTLFFVECTADDRSSNYDANVTKIASFFLRRMPQLTRIVPSSIQEGPDGFEPIYSKILLGFSSRINTLTTGASMLGHNPDAAFSNLTHVSLHNTDTCITSRYSSIAPASLQSLEINKGCSMFPWGMFGDGVDGDIVFPNLEVLKLVLPSRGLPFRRQKISQFRLRFPRLQFLMLVGTLDSFEDMTDLIYQTPIKHLRLHDNLDRIQHLDPSYVRDLDTLTIYPSFSLEPLPVVELDKDTSFVTMFNTPSKLTRIRLGLNTLDFPKIDTVLWNNLVDATFIVRSMELMAISAFLTQLPRLKTFKLYALATLSEHCEYILEPQTETASTSLRMLYIEPAHYCSYNDAWLYLMLPRLPSLNILYVPDFHKKVAKKAIDASRLHVSFIERIPLG
ncbi:hypothetical protein EC988_001194 [Linderina pennispora]|nr:hypothetical protein EC988_001194 [Linderina pennispora]